MIKAARRKVVYKGAYAFSTIAIPVIYRWARHFGELRYLSAKECRRWEKNMLTMLREYCKEEFQSPIIKVVYTFPKAKIEVINKRQTPDPGEIIVALCVKNDLERLKMLVEHYRKLGICRFAFLDNGSTDGTFEWAGEQPDIDLYRTYDTYQTNVKEGWMNRLVSHYGFNRWYVVTDSDELVSYVGMEEHPLSDVVDHAERHGIKRFKSLTLDMYADASVFTGVGDLKRDFCWMDADSYRHNTATILSTKTEVYSGGPRSRVMGSDAPLQKYPLIYVDEGMVIADAHYQYPFREPLKEPIYLAIQHYKFTEGDLKTYQDRSGSAGGFYKKGIFYKAYMDAYRENKDLSFMYEGSVKFEDSGSLKKVSHLMEIPFDK